MLFSERADDLVVQRGRDLRGFVSPPERGVERRHFV
jgi:hypothetical protein